MTHDSSTRVFPGVVKAGMFVSYMTAMAFLIWGPFYYALGAFFIGVLVLPGAMVTEGWVRGDHDQEPPETHDCPFCGSSFSTKKSMQMHAYNCRGQMYQ